MGSDLMDVIETGEKSIVFSQWDDMLIIIGKAFEANQVNYIRPKASFKLSQAINIFRGQDVPVLLLNLKQGAEGLTLIEATHIFMVEPLLHHGMDSQAISRIHRIGQTSKTYVHRYVIQDTIEVKIDELRMKNQKINQETSFKMKKNIISAGGIEG